jgi:hypothetical protein
MENRQAFNTAGLAGLFKDADIAPGDIRIKSQLLRADQIPKPLPIRRSRNLRVAKQDGWKAEAPQA